ncbi:M-phase phosphoprotein 8 [Toxocara canis]|nr:M-phase phosphoprotein 8 [Toxocara canis]
MASGRCERSARQEYEVAKILEVKGNGGGKLYLVQWRRYPLSESTWEPRSHFRMSPERIGSFPRTCIALAVCQNALQVETHFPPVDYGVFVMVQPPRSRSTSAGRKSVARSPARRTGSKSPSRSKISNVRSNSAKSPKGKPVTGKDSAKKTTLTKSPARKGSVKKSQMKKAASEKKRSVSKSPTRAAKKTPSKARTVSKSPEKSDPRHQSHPRSDKPKVESKSTPKPPAAFVPTPPKLFEPIQKSTDVPKQFESSFSPFAKTSVFPLHSLPYGSAGMRETPREVGIRHRAPPGFTSLPPKPLPPHKMAEYKKRAGVHLRRYARFYIIVFLLSVIALVIYHFGHGVQKTLKQLRTELSVYISSMKKQ